jgi:hypothetical protein
VRLGSTAVAVTAALILVTINIIARLGDLPPRVMNVAFVFSFAFFISSLFPQSILGFALTLRQWGDIYRRELDGIDVPTAADFRRAAARSLVVLTTVVLLSVLRNFYLRNEGEHKFLQSMAVLTGMEAGFIAGYLVATRNRSSVS